MDYSRLTPQEIAALRPLFEMFMAELDRVIETETSWMTADSVPFRDLLVAMQQQAKFAIN